MGSLSEGKGRNYGRKGGQGSDKPVRITPFDRREARANIQDPSRSGRRATPLTPEEILNAVRPPGASASQALNSPEAPTWVGKNDEAIRYAQELEKANRSEGLPKAADDVRFQSKDPSLRKTATDILSGTRKPPSGEDLVGGKTAPTGTGQAFRDSTIRPALSPATKKPEAIKQSEVSARARRFRQSFGTPTGADPFTGKPTYKPLDSLTKLPSSRTGRTPTPQAYSKVQVGDLDIKRLIRTTGPQGVPTDRGAENFLLNRETKGALGGRNARQISPEQGKAALERVKGFMADPEEVAKVKGQIKQEVGGRRAQLETPPSRPSRSTAASTGSTTAVRRVRVKDLTPSAPASRPTTSRSPQLPPATKQPAATPTVTKVKQALNLSIAKQPPAPEPSFKISGTTKQTTAPQLPPVGSTTRPEPVKQSDVSQRAQIYRDNVTPLRPPSTAGRNLEFGKTRRGSFTYKPGTTTPTTSPKTASPTPVADPTRRRASGDAGPSSRIDSGPKPPATEKRPVTPQQMRKNTQIPDLGSRSTTIRSGQSTTIRPRTDTPKQQRPGSGLGAGLTWGAFNAANAYTTAKAQGQSDEYARNLAIARGGGTAAGAVVTTKVLQSLLGRVPGGRHVANFAGPMLGSYIGDTVGAFGAGASKSDKEWMAKANRAVQPGVLSQNAQSKAGGRAVVRDAQGRERVGYASKLTGSDGVTKTVYKHANTPASLAYTSSNPLERVGRRTADAGIPWVSDFLKKRYAASDEAVRRANVATQRSRAGNK